MNATTHPVAPEELMAFLDGELPVDGAQSVSAHIAECEDCRALADKMQRTSQNLAAWKMGLIPSAINNQVTAAVKNGVIPKSSHFFQRMSFWTWKQWVGGIATVGAAAVLLASITVPAYLRSNMAAKEGAAIGRHRAQQLAHGDSMDKASTDSQPITDQESKVFSNAIPADSVQSLKTLSTPGAAADSNGQFHGLGDHARNSFSVDGQLITDQQAREFTGPMIARTVSLAIIVKDFDASRKSLDAILARHNGYAAGLNVGTPQGAARSLTASLRIPAPQLAAAMNELKALGRVENENQNGEEVTQQHADLVARLKNSRETEQRLQAILVQRTGKISDVLEVEQEIARVRGEIEQMEAEQKNVAHRVDFATIDLKLADEYKAQLGSPATSVSTQFHNALVNGYTNAAESLLGLLLFLVQYGPVLLLWIVLLSSPAWLLWRRWKRASAMV
jgi:hypothetical protein